MVITVGAVTDCAATLPGVLAWVVTVSDRCARGEQADAGGPLLSQALQQLGAQVELRVVADGIETVTSALHQALQAGAQLIITTGGTGVGPHDLTPEATAAVITRPVPGVAELLRREGSLHTPTAVLSRGLVGIVDPAVDPAAHPHLAQPALVVNLPGSPSGARDGIATLTPLLGHLLAQLQGEPH